MAKTFIQEGKTVDLVLPADKSAGDLVLVGSLLGVCLEDGLSGETRAVGIEGVYEVAKLTAADVSAGDKLNYNDTNEEMQLTTSDLDNCATAVEDAGTSVSVVKAYFTPV